MYRKFTGTIVGATVFLVIIIILGRGLGFIREVLFAKYFGMGVDFEIYLVGAVLPVTINTVIYFISQNYFIPAFNDIKSRGNNEEGRFTSESFWMFINSGIIIAAILYLLSGVIITAYSGDAGEYAQDAKRIFEIMLISIPLNAGYSLLSGYLNAEKRYLHPVIAQLSWNIGQILLIILFYEYLNVYVIPLGLILGYTMQFGYVYFLSRSKIKLSLKYISIHPYVYKSLSPIIMIILIEFFNQLYLVFDRYYYDRVDPGGIAAINYASTLFLLPLSIISLGLTTVIFPKMSEAFSNRNFKDLNNLYKKSLLYNCIIYIPIILMLIFGGDILIKLVFERGKFTGYSTQQTYAILQIYSLSLVFYSSYAVINKMIFSMGLVKQLLIITVFCLIIKLLLNMMLVEAYRQNGLALSTAISFTLLSIGGYIIVNNRLSHYLKQIVNSEN